jgi:gamma-glutamyltranspeptidase/glutathione hydrolase
MVNQVDLGMDPQLAVEAPRWVSGGPAASYAPDALLLESRIPQDVADGLRARGHNVFYGKDVDENMGTPQVIRVDRERGLLIGGADPRGDSLALGY